MDSLDCLQLLNSNQITKTNERTYERPNYNFDITVNLTKLLNWVCNNHQLDLKRKHGRPSLRVDAAFVLRQIRPTPHKNPIR